MAFFFSRDTKVFMEWSEDSTTANTALYEIPVLDGFSFSQGTNTSEVTLSEAADSAGYSKRGRAMFTDSFAPAEWSFSTYMRPTKSGSAAAYASGEHSASAAHFAVEGPLWAALSAKDYDKACGGDFTAGTGTGGLAFDFANSNNVQVGTFNMFFVLGASKDTGGNYATGTEGVTIYKLADCSVGSASIDFDIEGIAQIAWSGNGKSIEEVEALDLTTSNADAPKGLIAEGVGTTTNFIRNKLTDLSITYDASASTGSLGALGSSDQAYSITLTGGNITIENNLTYLTPETLGTVNLPIGHITGTRSVSGNFTCYLNSDANSSLDLFEKLQESRGVITNAFDLAFGIGGSTANTPRVVVDVPKAHLELPAHSFEDVVSVDVAFHGLATDLSSATAADATNEVKVTYKVA
jgi:hypothetical protein